VPARLLQVLVWLLAAAAVGFLFVYRHSRFTAVGIAEAPACTFTAPDSGWLVSLPVHLYQEVRQGQRLAVLRAVPEGEIRYTQAQFEAERASTAAQLEHLKIQAEMLERQMAQDYSEEQTERLYRDHQMALDVEKLRLLILEIQSVVEPLKIQLKDLELEKQALSDLVSKKAIEPYELQKVQAAAEALQTQIVQEEQRMQQAREDLEAAGLRLKEFRVSYPLPADNAVSLEPLRTAIAEQEKRLAKLFAPSFDIILEAPFDGVISSICYTAGQTVMKDMPILTLTAPAADFVVAWVEQERGGLLTLRQPVEVVKTSVPRKILRSEIAEIGPTLELIPERLWKNPALPEWGRPVRIPIPPQMQLIPNELVGVRGI